MYETIFVSAISAAYDCDTWWGICPDAVAALFMFLRFSFIWLIIVIYFSVLHHILPFKSNKKEYGGLSLRQTAVTSFCLLCSICSWHPLHRNITGEWQLTILMGISPFCGSHKTALIVISCDWTEVSLSSCVSSPSGSCPDLWDDSSRSAFVRHGVFLVWLSTFYRPQD